jgi:Lrp/AsnC ligand binding domain
VTAHDHAEVPATAQGFSSPVLAVIRLRLHPQLECEVFERWLRGIPAVLSAMLITGDADYELQVSCRCLADLGDTITWICGCPGVEVASAALVLHEVAGLGQQRRPYADEVTTRRLRTM